MSKGWIGVDLDGTLAKYDSWVGPEHIGEPVAAMVVRVQSWIQMGYEVRIFTARVSHNGTPGRESEAETARHAIEKWCRVHIGHDLRVTNQKDYAMLELWDDRCVQVVPNTGEPVGQSTRGL